MKASLLTTAVCLFVAVGVPMFAQEEPEAFDITIPAIPDRQVDIPNVPPVRLHYETQEHSSSQRTGEAEEAEGSRSSKWLDRGIGFERRTPPGWGESSSSAAAENPKAEAGDVNGSKVSLYLRGPEMNDEAVVSTLQKAGFSVLGSYPIDKKKTRVSIVFTDETLKANAAKPGRGFAAVLRVLVDHKDKMISITNPLYIEKAFLQDDYDEESAKRTLAKLRGAFAGLRNSKDRLKYALLPHYHFMDAMPYYQDMIEVGSGEGLLEKVRASKKVVFELELPDGAVLLGVKLGRRTSKFVKKIGYHNAALLPYPVLVENGKAKILEPKYYIAVMYPQLSMSNFMTIASVPGAIEKDCSKIFR